jgi:hypothetical protein
MNYKQQVLVEHQMEIVDDMMMVELLILAEQLQKHLVLFDFLVLEHYLNSRITRSFIHLIFSTYSVIIEWKDTRRTARCAYYSRKDQSEYSKK